MGMAYQIPRLDSDGDGIPDVEEAPLTRMATAPNYLDVDSDGDVYLM